MFTHRYAVVIATLTLTALVRPAGAQDLQQRLAAVKQSVAANQQALRSYTWLEKTELSLKGEVKATKVDSCRYGPDGKVHIITSDEGAFDDAEPTAVVNAAT